MLRAGDEVLGTQQGNNNCYCQDNELSWFDWSLTDRNADMLDFVRRLIALRKRHPSLMRRRFLSGEVVGGRGLPDIAWHGVTLGTPLWGETESRVLAFTLAAVEEDEADLHVILNMSDSAKEMEMPVLTGQQWQLVIDTDAKYMQEKNNPDQPIQVTGNTFAAGPRTVTVFESMPTT